MAITSKNAKTIVGLVRRRPFYGTDITEQTAIQIALLRVLQEREIERVGSSRPIPVDVRVVVATHRDLNALVAEGKFRQDLLYRLNVVPVQIPPLRERVADIPLLVEYFIYRFGKRAGKKFRTIDK